MYSKLPNLVIGFHGCDKSVYDRVLKYDECLKPSENDYDWLGHGIYFWENNPSRAVEYAVESKKRGKIKEEAVIGAVIDLGYCLNLVESTSLQIVKQGYELLCKDIENAKIPFPENKFGGSSVDLLLRFLDCAVIERIHQFNIETGEPGYDSVRGVFWEGGDLYPNSGFKEKNHIQLCVKNPNCIKGYFCPRKQDSCYPNP
jgi:hypothetical protein